MIEFVVEKEQTLKAFTDNTCALASFFWTQLLKDKEIKVNGKKVGADVSLQAGDRVCYYLTKKQEEKRAYFHVYADENVVIIDKESGVNAEAVFAALSREYNGACRFIHRLDRNTRGLMAFALTEEAERELLAAFKDRTATKIYHALCLGTFKRASGILTAYLKKDAVHALVRVFNVPMEDSEKIITEYRVLESREGETKVEITLHTGKTHQIRAHLSHVGCPVVGDMKYGDTEANKARNVARQQLVAKSLSFAFDGQLSYLNGRVFHSKFDV